MRSPVRRRVLTVVLAAALGGGCRDDGPGRGAAALDPALAPRLVELQNRGIAALERYDYNAAVAPLREAAGLAPRWTTARYHLALALLNADAATRPEALALLTSVAEEEPAHAHAHFMAGVVAANLGDLATARKHLARAWELTRDPSVGSRYAGSLTQGETDDDAAARVVLEEAHARAPALASVVNQLMLLYGRVGEAERQKEMLALLERLNAPVNPAVPGSKVGTVVRDAYGNLGRYSMALRDFDVPGAAAPAAAPDPAASAPVPLSEWKAGGLAGAVPCLGLAVFDWDADGDLDVFVCGGTGPAALLRNDTAGPGAPLAFTDVAKEAGADVAGVFAVAAGEFDVAPVPRDPRDRGRRRDVDLVLARADGLTLLLGSADGRFRDATAASGLAADPGGARALLAVDADQEGDLDLFVSAGAGGRNRLWANRGPGVFEEVGAAAGVAGDGGGYGPAVVIDADGDYDLDLLVTRPAAAPVLLLNDRLLRFRAGPAPAPDGVVAPLGALCSDLDRDGLEDVLLVGEAGTTLLSGRGDGTFEPRAAPGGGAPAALVELGASSGLDVVGADGARLVAAGRGGGLRAAGRLFDAGAGLANVAAADLDGDGREELLLVAPDAPVRAVRTASPAAGNAVVLDFEGVITDGQAGWSNLEGRGALVEVKAGTRWRMHRVGNPHGFGASPAPRLVAGVGAQAKADFVRVLWPDAVQQAVLDVPVGAPHVVVEEQRRPDSCPLLFSWDGERFAFVTDFIGAGGIGFLVEPGVFGAPDPTENVKVDARLVRPDASGEVVFRLVEAMEETCYLDHADLLVVAHPDGVRVELDERFSGAPPFPSGDLVLFREELLPVAARDGRGDDVLDAVLHADRRYAEDPRRHPRLLGATDPSVLELDFGARLAAAEGPLSLCLAGWIEYGYTRTSVAAAGERFAYLMPVLEAWDPARGDWAVVGTDLGYPAGFPRVMTYDLTGKLPRGATRLRIRTNFEVSWDRAWIAPRLPADVARTTVLPASRAVLRHLGYPREFSPDGRHPRIYDYHTLDVAMPWKTVEGDYTRFGDVRPLLAAADDAYVVHGKGEEIDLRFDASKLPPLPEGWTRSWVLRFTGWCKGQELYTAHGFTVEPLPFLGMPAYPYPDGTYPDSERLRRYRAEWNTRRVRAAPASGTR